MQRFPVPTCNLSSFFGIAPGDPGPDLATTVARTPAWTRSLKNGRPGAWYLLTWGPLLRLLPYGLGVPPFRPPAAGCGVSGFRGSLTLPQGFSGGTVIGDRVDAWHAAFLDEVAAV